MINNTLINTTISIDTTIENQALQIAKKRLKNGLFNRMGLSYEERLEKAYIGALGEICFEKILIKLNIPYITDYKNCTGPDHGDFFLNTIPRLSIDVKIAKTYKTPSSSWCFGFPVDQHPENYNFLVVGFWNPKDNVVEFYGSIPGTLLLNRPTVTRNSFTNTDYFTPNKEITWGELDRSFNFLLKHQFN